MSDFQDYLRKLKKSSSEEKLQNIRPECYRLLSQAQAHSLLVLLFLNDGGFENTEIEEMRNNLGKSIAAIDDLRELINAITT